MNRFISIVISVVLLHLTVLWALQTGLQHRETQGTAPVTVLVNIVPMGAPAAPIIVPTARPTPPRQTVSVAAPPAAVAVAATAPAPLAAEAVPPATSTATVTGNTSTTAPYTANPAATGTATQAPASATARVELPFVDADYLNNPKPPYPPLSKRLGEQGKVVVRTFIGADGIAKEASIKQSSGFARLDQAALTTALKWLYVPGSRAGVPEAMWFNVPFTFVLE